MDEREQLKQEEESAQSFMQDEYDRLTSLVCALQADPGDDRVFETFYQATYPRILYTARHLVNSEQAALDIAQEVYIAFYRNIGNIREPRAVISWLHRVTHSIARDYRERAAARNEDLINEGQEYLFTDVAEQRTDFVPHEQLDAQATQELIRGMLDELPEEQSRTLVYRFTEGLPLAEIAEIMDCTVSTVKSRLKYGKQKIEEQVYALEKRGIKLYSTSIPTLLLCLRWLMADRGGLSAEQAGRLLAQINSAIGAAASAAAGAAQSVGTAAKAAAAKTTGSTLGTKIAAGVAAAAIVVGGVVAVPRIMQKVNPPESVVQTEPAAEPETEPALTAEEKVVVQDDYDRNTAYLKVISDLQAQYGTPTQLGTNAYSGLLMTKLVDFDADGTDELLCVYTDKAYSEYANANLNMWYAIYSWNGTQADRITEQSLTENVTYELDYYTWRYADFYLYQNSADSKIYLCDDVLWGPAGGVYDDGTAPWSDTMTEYGLQNGTWTQTWKGELLRDLRDGRHLQATLRGTDNSFANVEWNTISQEIDKIRQNGTYYRFTFLNDPTSGNITPMIDQISVYPKTPAGGYTLPENPSVLIAALQNETAQAKQQLGDSFREYVAPPENANA